MKKKVFIILAVIFQIAVLVFMAAHREYILETGKTIYLRTAPIDPRDIFRGDYVRLRYEINSVLLSKTRGDIEKRKKEKALKVYSVLKEGGNGLAEFVYAVDKKPGQGLFIKGRTTSDRRIRHSSNTIAVKYGIESYYVQQGKGKEIERRRGFRNEVQIPLEVEVALGSSGTAIIKGHRWSPVGIGLKILESPGRNDPSGRKSAIIRVTMSNASGKPIAIVNLPNFCSFFLEPVVWAQKDWRPAGSPCDSINPTDDDVVVLQPEEKQSFDFDLADERWFMEDNGNVAEIGTLRFSELFRMIYRSPSEERTGHLKERELIWRGYLPSRAFYGRGRMD